MSAAQAQGKVPALKGPTAAPPPVPAVLPVAAAAAAADAGAGKAGSEAASGEAQRILRDTAREKNVQSSAWAFPRISFLPRGSTPVTMAGPVVRERLMRGLLVSPETARGAAAQAMPALRRQEQERLEVDAMRDPCSVRRSWNAQQPKRRLTSMAVRSGDNLADISAKHRLTVRELQRLNGLENDALYAGETLRVPEGLLLSPSPQLRPGLRRTARLLFMRQFVRPPCACCPAAIAAGLPRPKQPGPPPVPFRLPRPGHPKCALCKPLPKPRAGSAQPARLAGGRGKRPRTAQEGRFLRGPRGFSRLVDGWLPFSQPVLDKTSFLSSGFGPRWGRMHEGVDVAADQGVPIRAVAPGRVSFARTCGVYGRLLEIEHGSGVTTRYAHCYKLLSKEGQVVKRGQIVALVGTTGRSTGPHLHLEVRRYGVAYNPLHWVNI